MRKAFVDEHPELPSTVRHQLMQFKTTPEAVLRRLDYVNAHPRLSGRVRHQILHGNAGMGMRSEHVRASWGEPEEVRRSQGVETWVYPTVSRGGETSTLLTFRADQVVHVQHN